MPIYEYHCEACGHGLEVLQKVGAAPPSQCPQCGQERLRKQLTAAGFRLKGSGWYETDFKGKQPAGKEADKPKAEGKAKSESKPGPGAAEAKGSKAAAAAGD